MMRDVERLLNNPRVLRTLLVVTTGASAVLGYGAYDNGQKLNKASGQITRLEQTVDGLKTENTRLKSGQLGPGLVDDKQLDSMCDTAGKYLGVAGIQIFPSREACKDFLKTQIKK